MVTVLVVDDNPDVVEILSFLLEEQGYDVAVRHNGAEALTYCATSPPALVLLDVSLPVLDGLQVVRQMRADAELQTIPVVLLTARAHPDDVARGRDAGATSYLVKPFDVAVLLDVVAGLVG
ncbi:response regulator [Nocardioides zeae]